MNNVFYIYLEINVLACIKYVRNAMVFLKMFFPDLTSSRFPETYFKKIKHRTFLAPHTQGSLTSGFTKLAWPVLSHSETFN